jgi:hypothetical protein
MAYPHTGVIRNIVVAVAICCWILAPFLLFAIGPIILHFS